MSNNLLETFKKLNRLYESKEDKEKFINWAGKNIADKFYKLKDRLNGNEKDIYYWMKQSPEVLNTHLDNVAITPTKKTAKLKAQEGAEVLLDNSDWIILKITTPNAAQTYGKGTKWCITSTADFEFPEELYTETEEMLQDDGYNYFDYSKSDWDELVKDTAAEWFSISDSYKTMGEYYFYEYLNKDGYSEADGYYFLLRKQGGHKYCYLDDPDGEYLWDEKDILYTSFKELFRAPDGKQRLKELASIPKAVINKIPNLIDNLGSIWR